jgi:predicted ribosome quality control (RQC) complex YloA/Tae2 family protein
MADAAAAAPDTSSLLQHVTSLEEEKKKLADKLQQQEQMLEKFTQAKRDEMKKQFDGVIMDWLKEVDVSDEKVKQEFINGMEGIVKKTQQESPIWQVMCCASAAHRRNVTEMQKIQEDYNSLKTRVEGGTFRNEEARVGSKRSEPEPYSSGGGCKNYWDDFEAEIRGGAVQHFTPDPDRLKELRQDWRPLT